MKNLELSNMETSFWIFNKTCSIFIHFNTQKRNFTKNEISLSDTHKSFRELTIFRVANHPIYPYYVGREIAIIPLKSGIINSFITTAGFIFIFKNVVIRDG